MSKRKKNTTPNQNRNQHHKSATAAKSGLPKQEPKLSQNAIAALEHFFTCFPPKYFSRNIRNAVIQLLETSSAGSPLYQEELLAQLALFLPVLDLIEDEGRFEKGE